MNLNGKALYLIMPLEYDVVFKLFPLESCLATESLVHLAFLFNNGITYL